MSRDGLPLLPILTGATASGKTGLAIRVAGMLGLEVISADSRQVYRGLAVATAAPDAEELALARHHLVEHVSPWENYSAGRFAREARALLETTGPGGRPRFLVCGGSGFYLRALLDPVSADVAASPEVREQVRLLSASLDGESLRRHLLDLDPEAEWIPAGDRARLERYLEISLTTARPASRALRVDRRARTVDPLVFTLEPDLDWLMERIRPRSRAMLTGGMVEEIQALLDAGLPPSANALRAVGVDEVLELLAGNLDLESAVERLSLRTRQYARRQLIWLRGSGRRFLGESARLHVLDARRDPVTLAEEMARIIKQEMES